METLLPAASGDHVKQYLKLQSAMIPLLPSMSDILLLVFAPCTLFTGVMAASEIPPQMAKFQTFVLKDVFSVRTFFRYFAHCYFVLNFSLSAKKHHILVLRNTPNYSSVHSGMTGISLAELALHNK